MIEDVAPFGNVDAWRAKRSWATQLLHGGGQRRSGEGARRPPVEPPVPPAGGSPGHAKPPAQPGHTNVDVPAQDVANLLHPPADGTLGDVVNVAGTASSVVDAVGIGSAALAAEGTEGIDLFAMALSTVVGPVVGMVAAPILSTLLADVLLFLSMEVAWRSTQRGFETVGVRFALATLDESWSRYPVTLRVGDIDGRVGSSALTAWFNQQTTGGVNDLAYEGNREGGARDMARAGMQKVCALVQRTVDAAEARPEVVQGYARAAGATARAKMQQQLRRAIYAAIAAQARSQGAHR
jgi:hypothetical protein